MPVWERTSSSRAARLQKTWRGKGAFASPAHGCGRRPAPSRSRRPSWRSCSGVSGSGLPTSRGGQAPHTRAGCDLVHLHRRLPGHRPRLLEPGHALPTGHPAADRRLPAGVPLLFGRALPAGHHNLLRLPDRRRVLRRRDRVGDRHPRAPPERPRRRGAARGRVRRRLPGAHRQ